MNICLFGSARDSVPEVYIKETQQLGACLAERGHTLVFGGGARGMMGAAARGVHSCGGRIIGVAPAFFDKPGVFAPCDEMEITDTMSRRKARMVERSDGFIVAPGGVGTLDEFFEVLTLLSLDQHHKPLAVFNTAGFYDGLFAFMRKAEQEDFFLSGLLDLFGVFDRPEPLLDYLEQHQAN